MAGNVTMTSEGERLEANAGERQLGDLLARVDVSAPSSTKFDPIRAWAAGIVGVPPKKVAVYYVSKAGNFDVRFRQPGVLRDEPRLGLALIPSGVPVEPFLKPVRRSVQVGDFEAVVVCAGAKSEWRGVAAFVAEGSGIDATVGGLLDVGQVTSVAAPARAVTAPVGAGAPPPPAEPYDLARFCAETGLGEATAKDWFERLTRKGQLVIQGPPGTGKTWIAERLARLVVGSGKGVLDTVQFHPAWTYEDFVAGIAPVVRDGQLSYEARGGRFLAFCELALETEGDPCALVLDEFNRADIPRVFGELMHLLEYRDKQILLPFGPDDGRFAVPANVFIIATMNSADRSTVLLDHALRRRFSFVRLAPNYALLRDRLAADGIDASPLIEVLDELNAEIADADFEIGISFFLGSGGALRERLPSIWDGEVLPYVREILHARPDAVRRWSWDGISARFVAWA